MSKIKVYGEEDDDDIGVAKLQQSTVDFLRGIWEGLIKEGAIAEAEDRTITSILAYVFNLLDKAANDFGMATRTPKMCPSFA
ncbi:hypothetical protein FQN49_000013 [Arthroderma sp. PD_2]|nr:hypothetical protein FQN49_000013 [Arthroderma sp. PD_2]